MTSIVPPTLFTESYQQIKDNAFPYGTEKNLRITDENGVVVWRRGLLGLPSFVSQEVIDNLGTTLTAPIVITQAVVEYARAVLTVVEQIATLIIDPVYFITEAALNILREFLSSILNAKFSYIFHHTTVDDNKSVSQLLKDIGDSVTDRADFHRPVVDVQPLVTTIEGTPEEDTYFLAPDGARVFAVFLVFACPGVQSVYALLEILNEFIKVPNFRLPDFDLSVSALSRGPRNFDHQSPDWNGVNLSDAVPIIKSVYIGLNDMINLVAEARSSVLEMISEAIAVIEQKITQLEAISTYLGSIIEAIIRLLQFGPLVLYTVDGTYTGQELRNAIYSGTGFAPFGTDDVGVILGASVTGPLLNTETITEDLGATVDSFETTKQILKQIFGAT